VSEDRPFHWHGTVAEFDAEVRRRWIASSEQLGLDHGMPNAAAALAAQQPQPAPGPCPGCESLRRQCSEIAGEVGILAGALTEIRDNDHPYGSYARDKARAALDVLHGLAPQPAPELAAAMAKLRETAADNIALRELAGEILGRFKAAGNGCSDALVTDVEIVGWRERTGRPS
jgi:hypothetical protein